MCYLYHQNHIMSHFATALVTLCSANKVTTAGGTYSDLGSIYTDYEYRQALEHFCTSDDDVFPPKMLQRFCLLCGNM